MSSLSPEAASLYSTMLEDTTQTYSQQDLEVLLDEERRAHLIDYLRELIQQHLVKLLQESEGRLFYQAVNEQTAKLVRGMSSDEAMVYSYVEAAGREGIWTKTIRMRSGLHQHVVNRCLKSLEAKRITKSIKSVKFPTRKIVMLYHLQPSIEVTGGPWFTDTELDSEFVNLMLNVVWRFIARETFGAIEGPVPQVSQVPGAEKYTTLADIHHFVDNAKLSTVELTDSDITSLCDVLIYDQKIERVDGDAYRATWQSILVDQGRYEHAVPILESSI